MIAFASGVDAAAQLIALAARHLQLHAHAPAEVGAVFSASGRAVVAGGNDLVVADNDRAILPPQTRRALQHRLGDVQIVVFFFNSLHTFRLLFE